MDFSSSWLIPCQNCRRLTHHSSLAQAVSHLTLSDRILCATFKSLPGPLEAHPSRRLAVTALLVPTGTAWECCSRMETGWNWSEARACSMIYTLGARGKGLQSVFPLRSVSYSSLSFCPLCWDIRGSCLLSIFSYWDMMDTSTQYRSFPQSRKPLVGKVEF